MPEEDMCHNCGFRGMSVFYEVDAVPVHSVLLMPTREAALNCPKGTIALGFCRHCGFISNTAFDPAVHEYSSRYEETQGFSSTFNAFHRKLAQRLVERYGLYDKDVIEIGCGKGEFLSLLCELGENRGVGFDPAYVEGRSGGEESGRVRFIKDFYSEKYTDFHSDFICCKMTLEHIHRPAEFLRIVRRSIGDASDTVVFFQVPDVTRILHDTAFWDIYYEHCSYFSPASLAYLFRSNGFDILEMDREYDGQYLTVTARPGTGGSLPALAREEDLKRLAEDVKAFSQNYRLKVDTWRRELQQISRSEQKAVLWGGGSKAVALLTTLGIKSEIAYAIDINPFKHGTYLAGTGQEIVGPQFLQAYHPDVVVVMNPIYREEICRDLSQMQLSPEMLLAA